MPLINSHNLLLRELQASVKERLDGDAWFNDIIVITEERGDVNQLIELACSKLGTCVLIETPILAANANQEINGAIEAQIPVLCTVWEFVPINRDAAGTKKHGIDTAQVALFLLHHYAWYLDSNGHRSYQIFAREQPLTRLVMPDRQEARGLIAWQVRLQTTGAYCYAETAADSALVTNKDQRILTNLGAEILLN